MVILDSETERTHLERRLGWNEVVLVWLLAGAVVLLVMIITMAVAPEPRFGKVIPLAARGASSRVHDMPYTRCVGTVEAGGDRECAVENWRRGRVDLVSRKLEVDDTELADARDARPGLDGQVEESEARGGGDPQQAAHASRFRNRWGKASRAELEVESRAGRDIGKREAQ